MEPNNYYLDIKGDSRNIYTDIHSILLREKPELFSDEPSSFTAMMMTIGVLHEIIRTEKGNNQASNGRSAGTWLSIKSNGRTSQRRFSND